ncbi:MAG: cytochrome c biogenesis protein CcsA, partial [Candidatus Thorarchaeota archaeon]
YFCYKFISHFVLGEKMDIGYLSLLFALILFIIDFFLLLNRNKFQNWLKYSNIIFLLGVLSTFISYLFFHYIIQTFDLSYYYVSHYTSSDMTFFYKIASSWSGQAGSYFLWGLYLVGLYFVFRVLLRKNMKDPVYSRTSLFIVVNVIALLALVLVNDPFLKNATIPLEGTGLNPVLATFWNVIHPPIVLFSYALFTLPFALSLSRYSFGSESYEATKEIIPLRRFTIALGWFVITIGLVLGGYWAYVTLGWGGFWAWDPVETGALIPWLFATVFFHFSPSNRENVVNFDKEFLGILPFISVLYATLITRSGLLVSVHSFAITPTSIFLFAYVIAIVILVFLIYVNISKIQLFLSWITIKKLSHHELGQYIAYLGLLAGTIGIMFGLLIPLILVLLPGDLSTSVIVDKRFFNIIIGLFGLVVLIATFFLDFVYPRSTEKRIYIILGSLIAGLFFAVLGTPEVINTLLGSPLEILYSIFGGFITTSAMANVIIPVVLVLIVCSLTGLMMNYRGLKLPTKVKIRRVSQTLLHLSILIALLGALYSSNLTTTYNDDLSVGQEMFLNKEGTLTLKFIKTSYTNETATFVGEITSFIEIRNNGNLVGNGVLHIMLNKEYGWYNDVLIITTFYEDFYITALFTLNIDFTTGYVESIPFQVQIKPLISVFWAGTVLLILSMIPILILTFKRTLDHYSKEKENFIIKDNFIPENNVIELK